MLIMCSDLTHNSITASLATIFIGTIHIVLQKFFYFNYYSLNKYINPLARIASKKMDGVGQVTQCSVTVRLALLSATSTLT